MRSQSRSTSGRWVAAVWPHSIRHGREVATIMLILIMAFAYAPSSPLILPFALLYFIMSWCGPSPPGT